MPNPTKTPFLQIRSVFMLLPNGRRSWHAESNNWPLYEGHLDLPSVKKTILRRPKSNLISAYNTVTASYSTFYSLNSWYFWVTYKNCRQMHSTANLYSIMKMYFGLPVKFKGIHNMAWVEFQEGPFPFLRKKNLRPMFYALTWNSRFQSVFMSVEAIFFVLV